MPVSHRDNTYLATFGLEVDCNTTAEKNHTTSVECLPDIGHPLPTTVVLHLILATDLRGQKTIVHLADLGGGWFQYHS